ncbi:hypothetical protein [Domibacillus iocasae]|uniref:hypothetical protein n=1 Tax=Domibacillus iocasae TaxID=1714016 RepID=UPI001470B0A5|nr:hypothetical protein [Domibacillus iocasae]
MEMRSVQPQSGRNELGACYMEREAVRRRHFGSREKKQAKMILTQKKPSQWG